MSKYFKFKGSFLYEGDDRIGSIQDHHVLQTIEDKLNELYDENQNFRKELHEIAEDLRKMIK